MMTYKQLQEHIDYYKDALEYEKAKIALAEKEIERDPTTALTVFIDGMRDRLKRYENRYNLFIEIKLLHYKKESQNDSI